MNNERYYHKAYVESEESSLIDELKKHAQLSLPSDSYYEIRQTSPDDVGRDQVIAWYHQTSMQKHRETVKDPVYDVQNGYIYHGRFKTTVNS